MKEQERHPLTGGCGLKPSGTLRAHCLEVSPPHGGVWIETLGTALEWQGIARHPLTGGCGLKQIVTQGSEDGIAVTPSRGGVD